MPTCFGCRGYSLTSKDSLNALGSKTRSMLPAPTPDTVPNRWPPSANIWTRRNGKRRTRRFPWSPKSSKTSRRESTKRQKNWNARPLSNSSENQLCILLIQNLPEFPLQMGYKAGRLLSYSGNNHEPCSILRKENLLHA